MRYKKPSQLIGWDFSRLSVVTEGPKPDYEKIVKTHLNKNTVLLDLGTGGGEKILLFAPLVRKAVGIDISNSMIQTANQSVKRNGVANAEFAVADSSHIPFANNYFDVVIDRHAPFDAKEVHRVLKKNGFFIAQQVSEGDKINWKKIFCRGQEYGIKDGTLKDRYLDELKQAGFEIVEAKVVDTVEYYKTMDDVIFLLGNTPTIPGFDVVRDESKLKIIEKDFCTPKGIKTNSRRFLIVAKKR